jgi:hypothetical protein
METKYICKEMTMKKLAALLSIFMLIAIGCGKPESKLAGKWKSSETKGFVAEFNKDHTGTTETPIPGHAGIESKQTAKTPFNWTISNDGKIKITEDKTEYFGKLNGKKLEIEVNGAIVVLEKAK